VEYELLAREGCFDEEKVELLFGMVVPMAPIDPAHSESVYWVHRYLQQQLGARANVYCQTAFAASDESVPQPDVFVTPPGRFWDRLHETAHLVVEVANSSVRRDRVKRSIYARADVREYWIVNHADGLVEVYRDRVDGSWQHTSIHRRGETLSPLAFPDVQIAIDEILPPV
jgi:Uma2 family endonuclease